MAVSGCDDFFFFSFGGGVAFEAVAMVLCLNRQQRPLSSVRDTSLWFGRAHTRKQSHACTLSLFSSVTGVFFLRGGDCIIPAAALT